MYYRKQSGILFLELILIHYKTPTVHTITLLVINDKLVNVRRMMDVRVRTLVITSQIFI